MAFLLWKVRRFSKKTGTDPHGPGSAGKNNGSDHIQETVK